MDEMKRFLSYYYANQLEIDAQIQEEEVEEERIEQSWLQEQHAQAK